jgi:ABC-type transport system involved in multi-copper enzyme maturation permease subunit
MKMIKLIGSEWTKFRESRKNRIIILLLICYLIGIVFYYVNLDKNYFPLMLNKMERQSIESQQKLSDISLKEEHDKDYEKDPREIEFLTLENQTSVLLMSHYEAPKFSDWKQYLERENRKFNNLIFGEENNYINLNVLKARNQDPAKLKQQIIRNEYLIENDIEIDLSPYKLSGIQFLTFLLKSHSPMIIIVFAMILSIDVFLGEMEEGSYKLYFTQPYSRKRIYWSKILGVLLFIIGIIFALIIVLFIIVSIIYGVGKINFPQVIGSKEILTSLTNNAKILGQFQVISTSQYLILGYIQLLFMMIMTILSTVALSTWLNSISKTLGLTTGLIMLNYVFEATVTYKSILRFVSPLSYLNIEQVIKGEVNASYLVGIIISIALSIVLTSISYVRFINSDLLGTEN